MNRRGFLKLLLPAAGAVAVAAELLPGEIWTPNRTFFLPPRGGWPSVWAVNQLGGFMYSRELADKLRMNIQPLIRFRDNPGGLVVPSQFAWRVYSDMTVQRAKWVHFG